MVTWSELVK
jgi:hypothetical protein